MAEDLARELRRAASSFRALRDAGDPWPGTVEASAGEAKTKTRRLHQE